jgi:hypothetical protein
MAIIKQQFPYEYLVRFNTDGSVRGQHIKYLDRVYDDQTNEVYAEKEGSALSVGDEQSAVMLDAALGQVTAALAKAENAERQAKLAIETELQTERAARQLAESQKEAALAELQAERQAKRNKE